MAAFHILSILEKQKVLGLQGQESTLKAWGDWYKSQGRIYDALDFYDKAAARSEVTAIRREAVASGNLFLLKRALQILKEEPSAPELAEVAARTATDGRDAYARVARGEPAVPPASGTEDSKSTPEHG